MVPNAISINRSTSCSQSESVAQACADSPRLSMSASQAHSAATPTASSAQSAKQTPAQVRTRARGRSSMVRSMPGARLMPELASVLAVAPDSLRHMIDPRILRDEPDRVRAAQAKRGLSDEVVDRALSADAARRAAIAAFESKRAEQKQLGKQVAQAQGEEKQQLLTRTKTLAAEVKQAEAAQV